MVTHQALSHIALSWPIWDCVFRSKLVSPAIQTVARRERERCCSCCCNQSYIYLSTAGLSNHLRCIALTYLTGASLPEWQPNLAQLCGSVPAVSRNDRRSALKNTGVAVGLFSQRGCRWGLWNWNGRDAGRNLSCECVHMDVAPTHIHFHILTHNPVVYTHTHIVPGHPSHLQQGQPNLVDDFSLCKVEMFTWSDYRQYGDLNMDSGSGAPHLLQMWLVLGVLIAYYFSHLFHGILLIWKC